MSSDNIPRVKIPTMAAAAAAFGGKDSMSPTPGDDAYSTHSDEALEVSFDDRDPYRRKSSMVVSDHRHRNFMADASCFVHSLLESQKSPNTLSHVKEKDFEHLDENEITPAGDGATNGEQPEPQRRGGSSEASPANSRLLTKKQLAEMAWGVRELSKHLGSIRIKPNVRNVFILVKSYDVDLISHTRELVSFLLGPKQHSKYYNVYVENTLKKSAEFDSPSLIRDLTEMGATEVEKRLRYWDNLMCKRKPNLFDFGITLGGDGTVLYASYLFQQIVPPCLSFALGSLGFLTKFDFNDYPTLLETAFREGISVALRLRFECTVMRSQPMKDHNGNVKSLKERDVIEELVGEECENDNTHKPDGSWTILNDVVVDRGPNGTMSSIELFGDDEHFTNVQADGLCVATPTGSTAYNLAAGGSLCHPDNPVMLVTAICAHTLSFRPIVLPDTMVLRIAVPYTARTACMASFDGKERVELGFGDYVSISASRYPFAVIMNTKDGKKNEDWVRSISDKLQWNTRERQKAFKPA